jgi:hypothetical protein
MNQKIKKASLLGDIIIILIISVFVYLGYVIITPNPFLQVEEIYAEYGVSKTNLIPDDYLEYTTSLKTTNTEVTLPIIEFVHLEIEQEKLQRNINQNLLLDCITSDLYRKFESFINQKDITLRRFKETKTVKHEKIFWNEYIDILEHKNIENVFERIKLLKRC